MEKCNFNRLEYFCKSFNSAGDSNTCTVIIKQTKNVTYVLLNFLKIYFLTTLLYCIVIIVNYNLFTISISIRCFSAICMKFNPAKKFRYLTCFTTARIYS